MYIKVNLVCDFRYLGIRITIKEEIYGYDIPIPEGAKIKPEQTKVKVSTHAVLKEIRQINSFLRELLH